MVYSTDLLYAFKELSLSGLDFTLFTLIGVKQKGKSKIRKQKSVKMLDFYKHAFTTLRIELFNFLLCPYQFSAKTKSVVCHLYKVRGNTPKYKFFKTSNREFPQVCIMGFVVEITFQY